MYTELLIAIPILFSVINIAVIVELLAIRRKQSNSTAIELYHAKTSIQPQFTLLDSPLIVPVKHNPLLLSGISPDYELADSFINEIECIYTVKNKPVKTIHTYNYSHLRDYLALHLVKYPDGKLPQLPCSIMYYDNHAQYTMNFYDANDCRIERYIKSAISLLKVKKSKTKQLDILKEANKIVKSKGTRTIKKTVKRNKKVLVEVK